MITWMLVYTKEEKDLSSSDPFATKTVEVREEFNFSEYVHVHQHCMNLLGHDRFKIYEKIISPKTKNGFYWVKVDPKDFFGI